MQSFVLMAGLIGLVGFGALLADTKVDYGLRSRLAGKAVSAFGSTQNQPSMHSNNPEKNERKLESQVNDMFKKFPPEGKG